MSAKKKEEKKPEPAIGAIRIRYDGDDWLIEEWCAERRGYFFGSGGYDFKGWDWKVRARTLWGIKREWRKRYGYTKPFPAFTVWTSEVVT